jgi:anti-sigma regulatory factor (Ser/Thr protein kinase)
MNADPHIRVQLVSDPIYLSGARELVGSVAKRLGFDDLHCSKIALAVDEALCNIIRHGYDRAADKPIWISLWPLEEGAAGGRRGLRVVIEDEARQVDPASMKGRDLQDIRPGGLGVYIIREVMDEVSWEPRSSVGMKLTMIKHAPALTPEKAGGGCCGGANGSAAGRSASCCGDGSGGGSGGSAHGDG